MLPSAISDLERSGIAPEDAERAGMFDVPDASAIHRDFKPVPATVMPYFQADGALMTFGPSATPFCRVRYLETPKQGGFVPQKPQR